MNRHALLSAIAVTLVAGLFVTGCNLMPEGSTQRFANEAPTPTPIPTAVVPIRPKYTVQRGTVVDEVEFTGRVSAVLEEELFFRTDGRVRSVFFRRDDLVQEGEVIADLEIAGLERELEVADLDLERAKSRLSEAQRNWEYDVAEAQAGLEIARLQLAELQAADMPDATDIAVQAERVRLAEITVERLSHGVDPMLQNDLERAQLQVDKLKAEIAEAQIVAPFDGQILSLSLVSGQAVEGYRPVVVLADDSELQIRSNLLSSQMEDLAEGMAATVLPVRRPGVELPGAIAQLPYPYGTGGSPGVNVEERDPTTHISLDDPTETADFELGDLVNVVVEIERKDDVLWLPPQALRNFDGRRFAVIEEEGVQRRVDVTVGIETAERVEVEEGLEEGQEVLGQ